MASDMHRRRGMTSNKGATMKRTFLMTTVLAGLALAGAGWAAAQTAATAHDHDHAAPAKGAPTKAAPGPGATSGGMGMGMMGGESGMCPMMGNGGMGNGGMGNMGGGMGAMMNMGGAGTQVAVKNTDKGVTITLTATDPAKVTRLQKMAEAMRLMHEATAP
jgi:hypothetical protein